MAMIVQITSHNGRLYALDEHGRLWWWVEDFCGWTLLSDGVPE